MNLKDIVQKEVQKIFLRFFPSAHAEVKVSDRPDISDFQCNSALQLAKTEHKNPREIAQQVVQELEKISLFSKVSVDGPGFINMRIDNSSLIKYAYPILSTKTSGYTKEKKQKIVLDYCGPNIGKSLHVGHLRSAVIGESIKRLLTFAGDTVIGDTHLGDWGRPMGLIITEIQHQFPDLICFSPSWNGQDFDLPLTEEDLKNMYPTASSRAKEDEAYLAQAKSNTRLLQEGNKCHTVLWEKFKQISIQEIKRVFKRLDIQPDVWYGESQVHQRCLAIVDRLKEKEILIYDDGAYIIPLGESKNGNSLPPLIAVNSEKAVMYALTDLATIEERKEEFNPDTIIYLTDLRQELHFEQVFLGASKAHIADNIHLEFHGFGTINGKDNKPYKTRAGGVMPLMDFINLSVQKTYQKIQDGLIGKELTNDEQKEVAEMVGVSALKFADLMNDKRKNYIFDEDKLTNTEGKTGPYILYSLVRLKSILSKLDCSLELTENDIPGCSSDSERQLLLSLYNFPEAIQNAYDLRAPHVLCDYLFKLAQQSNTFYHDCPIKGANKTTQKERIALIKYVLYVAQHLTQILGLPVPEKM